MSQVTHLKAFSKKVKTRYARLANPYVCNNLRTKVTTGSNGSTSTTTYRCPADASSGSCYVCDYTGYSCQHCGDNVAKGKPFCSSSCSGQYYAY
jgi:hypothetical protein